MTLQHIFTSRFHFFIQNLIGGVIVYISIVVAFTLIK